MGGACCKEEPIDFSQEVELNHFNLLRVVGKGAFGKVRIVQHKQTKEIWALKYINKEQCIGMKAIDNIIQERKMLEEINHPFICNLRYAFQDDENLFMVIDLMLGGDMRFHLERAGHFSEEAVKLYMAECALALSYLHGEKKIVHRDLKPDNILLDAGGHAHLTDFNIAVKIRPERPLTAVAGSMAYMAPEIFKRAGYNESVDWWSLGVVMYELLFEKRPFHGKTNELLQKSIMQDTLEIPPEASKFSPECIDCMKGFLTRDIMKRLGCKEAGGLDAIKRHPFFSSIDWDKVLKKEINPAFVPDPNACNFDASHELEELLLEDNPLRASVAPGGAPTDGLSKEMMEMEMKFTVFDFKNAKPMQTTTAPVEIAVSRVWECEMGMKW
ncbi:kinase-like protein [Gonapodya prolifera JEL478]|uniref:Kinase-like protein n=1 Tax=Gonapodya prolifera (strain JEL478) TaxID=1344416 RepID=A0A139ATX9_GONPJ|nr:kinase-like protein [Gonapodya prolifera JEL478]|eukprot:KXS19955.1 kinase-like protein [Gonapodya prolifera JEL478]